MGRGSRPSEGYEAINKRFVVNKLANISAGCSFFITHLESKIPPHLFCRPINILQGAHIYIASKERGRVLLLPRFHVMKGQWMALKRMAVQRINANAVSFPRAMILGRVQPKFKDRTVKLSAGVLCAMQVCRAPGRVLPVLPFYTLCLSAH